MKSLVFPSVLGTRVAEKRGEKAGRQSVSVLLSFFFWGWHSILTYFTLAKRRTAGNHAY